MHPPSFPYRGNASALGASRGCIIKWFVREKILGVKKILAKKNTGEIKLLAEKHFWRKKAKLFLMKKHLVEKMVSGSSQVRSGMCSKISDRKSLAEKIPEENNFWWNKIWQNNISDKKNFWSQKISDGKLV